MKNKESYYWTWAEGKSLLFMMGDFEIQKVPFLDLNIGDKITQVGEERPKSNRGMAVLNRFDKYRPYITYAGIRFEKMATDENSDNITKILLFEVREEDKPVGIDQNTPFYIGYIILNHKNGKIELKTVDYSAKTLNIYKPFFMKTT